MSVDEVDVLLQLRVLLFGFVCELEYDVELLRVEVDVPVEFGQVRRARLVLCKQTPDDIKCYICNHVRRYM